MTKEKRDIETSKPGAKKKKFIDFFLSFKPNGYIGCLEYVILSVAGVILSVFLVFVMWGTGVSALLLSGLPSGNYNGAFGAFSFLMAVSAILSSILMLLVISAYHARLLQLRLIDIGLGSNLSVPSLASKFWCCFVVVIAASLLSILAFLLFAFCCLWQGKTYKDNRDLFDSVDALPAKEELVRQMREKK